MRDDEDTKHSVHRSARRDALKLIAGSSLFWGSTVVKAAPTQLKKARTFVLVHGAWHGGWCWKFVAERLRKSGHLVLTPSLTGLADRSHLLATSITLQTHIDDIVNLFRWGELEDVVLVAHSYGGWAVSGALEQIRSKVRSVIFVDAFLPENGQRVLELNSAKFQKELLDAIDRGEAGRPVPKAAAFGIKRPEDAAWVQAMMTPQPTGVAKQAIVLTGERDRVPLKAYIRASGYEQPHFDSYLKKAKSDLSWRTIVLDKTESGHDVMIDTPDHLAALIAEFS